MTKSTLYHITRRPRGLFFVCLLDGCGHEVDVNSFPLLRNPGLSKRTLAADAMRRHQEQAHKKKLIAPSF